MLRVLSGRGQLYLFLLGYHRTYLASVIVTALGILGTILGLLVPDLRSVVTPSTVLGVVSTLFGVGLFFKDTMDIRQVQLDLYAVHKPISAATIQSDLRLSDTYSSYTLLSFRDQHIIYSPTVNTLLRERPIQFRFDTHPFHLPPAAWLVAPLALTKAYRSAAHIFNSPKVRLRYDPTEQAILSGKIAELQRTDYFSELCTNAMVEWHVLSKSDNSLRFDGMDLMANNGTILDFEDSECGCCNLIGVSTLAFTRDGYLIIPVQGEHTQKHAGYLAPSGSGSADLADLKDTNASLQEFIKRATERELREECGISDPKHTIRTDLIGFCRVLNRGGLPEFFSVSFINANHSALHVSKPEAAYIAYIDRKRVNRDTAGAVIDQIRHYREGPQAQSFSLQLYLNLLFLEGYLESNPALFEQLTSLPIRQDMPENTETSPQQ